MKNIKKEMVEFMVKSNAIKFGLFKLSSGKESPYYIDLRILPSFPSYFKVIIDEFKKILKDIEFDYLCSIPTAGLVYASTLAYLLEKPFIYIRKESKGYGTNNLIEGYLRPASNVVIIDDVITTGRSIINAIEVIRTNGSDVSKVLVIVDRLEGAKDALKKLGIELISLLTIKEIADILYSENIIDEKLLSIINEQIVY